MRGQTQSAVARLLGVTEGAVRYHRRRRAEGAVDRRNRLGNEMQKAGKRGYNCAENEKNYAGHIWDRRDANGHMGATACIVLP